jgi:hypothetical protein
VEVADAVSAAAGAAVSVALRLGIDQRSPPFLSAPILFGLAFDGRGFFLSQLLAQVFTTAS